MTKYTLLRRVLTANTNNFKEPQSTGYKLECYVVLKPISNLVLIIITTNSFPYKYGAFVSPCTGVHNNKDLNSPLLSSLFNLTNYFNECGPFSLD